MMLMSAKYLEVLTLFIFVDTNSDLAPTKLYQNLWLEVNNGSFFRDGYTFLNFSGKKWFYWWLVFSYWQRKNTSF